MALTSLRDALEAAAAGNYAVGAFNVSDALQAEAVLDAAVAESSPVIIQTLVGCSAHNGDERWWKLLRGLAEDAAQHVPVVLHLDHGPTFDDCRAAIDAGFSSVMIDGSLSVDRRTPASFEENVALTKRVVAIARPAGVSVEGELGTIGGTEGGTPTTPVVLADPDQAADFVRQTEVDALAVAIGTSHGAYKFDTEPIGDVLRLDIAKEISERVPGIHLVLHGSSSLPSSVRATVNQFGGNVPESWGTSMEEKISSISLGVRKINQGMDSFLYFTAALREFLAQHPEEVDPAGYLRAGRLSMQHMLQDRMRAFRSSGTAAALVS